MSDPNDRDALCHRIMHLVLEIAAPPDQVVRVIQGLLLPHTSVSAVPADELPALLQRADELLNACRERNRGGMVQ